MKRLRFTSLTLLAVLALPNLLAGETCQYGLYGASRDACLALQKEALQRVASAKTICYSANSEVQWSKNNKEPAGAFATMRAGARTAMKGFSPLYTCERADLVVRIDFDNISETVKITVTDAESGDSVFHEERSVSDLGSDVSRMAAHFQSMVLAARTAARAAREDAQAKAKEEAFLANLPKHWRNVNTCAAGAVPPCPQGPAIDLSVRGNLLYEFATTTQALKPAGSIKSEINCVVKRGTDETEAWAGECTYELFWNNAATPSCTVRTKEIITSIAATAIAGRSQKIDFATLHQNPPICPTPGGEIQDFTLAPDIEQQ